LTNTKKPVRYNSIQKTINMSTDETVPTTLETAEQQDPIAVYTECLELLRENYADLRPTCDDDSTHGGDAFSRVDQLSSFLRDMIGGGRIPTGRRPRYLDILQIFKRAQEPAVAQQIADRLMTLIFSNIDPRDADSFCYRSKKTQGLVLNLAGEMIEEGGTIPGLKGLNLEQIKFEHIRWYGIHGLLTYLLEVEASGDFNIIEHEAFIGRVAEALVAAEIGEHRGYSYLSTDSLSRAIDDFPQEALSRFLDSLLANPRLSEFFDSQLKYYTVEGEAVVRPEGPRYRGPFMRVCEAAPRLSSAFVTYVRQKETRAKVERVKMEADYMHHIAVFSNPQFSFDDAEVLQTLMASIESRDPRKGHVHPPPSLRDRNLLDVGLFSSKVSLSYISCYDSTLRSGAERDLGTPLPPKLDAALEAFEDRLTVVYEELVKKVCKALYRKRNEITAQLTETFDADSHPREIVERRLINAIGNYKRSMDDNIPASIHPRLNAYLTAAIDALAAKARTAQLTIRRNITTEREYLAGPGRGIVQAELPPAFFDRNKRLAHIEQARATLAEKMEAAEGIEDRITARTNYLSELFRRASGLQDPTRIAGTTQNDGDLIAKIERRVPTGGGGGGGRGMSMRLELRPILTLSLALRLSPMDNTITAYLKEGGDNEHREAMLDNVIAHEMGHWIDYETGESAVYPEQPELGAIAEDDQHHYLHFLREATIDGLGYQMVQRYGSSYPEDVTADERLNRYAQSFPHRCYVSLDIAARTAGSPETDFQQLLYLTTLITQAEFLVEQLGAEHPLAHRIEVVSEMLGTFRDSGALVLTDSQAAVDLDEYQRQCRRYFENGANCVSTQLAGEIQDRGNIDRQLVGKVKSIEVQLFPDIETHAADNPSVRPSWYFEQGLLTAKDLESISESTSIVTLAHGTRYLEAFLCASGAEAYRITLLADREEGLPYAFNNTTFDPHQKWPNMNRVGHGLCLFSAPALLANMPAEIEATAEAQAEYLLDLLDNGRFQMYVNTQIRIGGFEDPALAEALQSQIREGEGCEERITVCAPVA
jgi:hypothetical protein